MDNRQSGSNPHFTLTPLTLHIGARIDDIDLRVPLSAEALQQVREALVKWKVIFFQQQSLDHAAHVAFARQLGEPTIGHAVFGHDDNFPEIYSVAKHRTANSADSQRVQRPWTGWHTDITAAVNPPSASILRGVDIPPYGGDTFWTNLAVAYNGLSETLRAFLDTLNGVHRFKLPASVEPAQDYVRDVQSRYMESVHPLVTVHPESAEKLLYVSPYFLTRIEGLAARESDVLLEMLWEHVVRPEYTVRYKWQPGDVAVWDNRATAHLAPADIFESDFDRQLYRVTLVGEKLKGVDGRESRAISGEPILSAQDELQLRKSV